jgi:hypothetical protein
MGGHGMLAHFLMYLYKSHGASRHHIYLPHLPAPTNAESVGVLITLTVQILVLHHYYCCFCLKKH